jgi:hypothetical protein
VSDSVTVGFWTKRAIKNVNSPNHSVYELCLSSGTLNNKHSVSETGSLSVFR